MHDREKNWISFFPVFSNCPVKLAYISLIQQYIVEMLKVPGQFLKHIHNSDPSQPRHASTSTGWTRHASRWHVHFHRPHPHRTRTCNASKWDLLMWMGVSTLHASNIKGFAFEFAVRVLCGLGLKRKNQRWQVKFPRENTLRYMYYPVLCLVWNWRKINSTPAAVLVSCSHPQCSGPC